jgi:hypothetical protein
MEFSKTDIQILINAVNSNDISVNICDKFLLDKHLSNEFITVFTTNDDNVIVIHKECNDINKSLHNIFKYNDIRNAKLYKKHLRKYMKVHDYYSMNNSIIVIGIGKSNDYAKTIFIDDLADQYIDINNDDNDNDNDNDDNDDDTDDDNDHDDEDYLFVKKVDYSKIRVKRLIEFIIKHKKLGEIDINTTGLTKKQLIRIVKKIIN